MGDIATQPNRTLPLRPLGRWAALALLASLTSGCAAPLILGAGAMTVNAAGERRGAVSYLDDNWIAMRIRTDYVRSDVVKLANVNVSVYQGKVLLTGVTASDREIDEAVKLAKAVNGVKEVRNELKVAHESYAELAQDSAIGNAVKARLLTDEQVRGMDIHVEVTKSVVYLLGMAHSVKERDQAIAITQSTPGVKEVVSYVEVDPNAEPVAGQPKPPQSDSPAASTAPSGDSGSSNKPPVVDRGSGSASSGAASSSSTPDASESGVLRRPTITEETIPAK
ncbi:MAG: BON domain-containing protein [Magnetococcales bacterium]|nr:BON domain-containing protein [Magnetococcales bacterium]